MKEGDDFVSNNYWCECNCADIATQKTHGASNEEDEKNGYVYDNSGKCIGNRLSMINGKRRCPICLRQLSYAKARAASKMYWDIKGGRISIEQARNESAEYVNEQKRLQDEMLRNNRPTIGDAIGRALNNGMNAVSSAHNKSNDDLFNDAVNSSGWKKAAAMQELKNRSGGGGCFITTAVCGSFNKPDNCYELTMFRDFRDKWLTFQSDGKELIQRYYQIAPSIVKKINGLPNANTIYLSIWKEYLQPCLRHLERKNYLACKQKYVQMVEELSHRF